MQRRPSMASPEVRASSFPLCRVCAAFSRCPSASFFSPVDLRQEEPANTALVHKLRASVLKTECRSGTMSICFKMNQGLQIMRSADNTWYFQLWLVYTSSEYCLCMVCFGFPYNTISERDTQGSPRNFRGLISNWLMLSVVPWSDVFAFFS